MAVDTTTQISQFRINDDRLSDHFTRVEKRLFGQEGAGRTLLTHLRESHTAYARKLLQYAQLAHVDEAFLPFVGRATEVVAQMQDDHERLLSSIEMSIDSVLGAEA